MCCLGSFGAFLNRLLGGQYFPLIVSSLLVNFFLDILDLFGSNIYPIITSGISPFPPNTALNTPGLSFLGYNCFHNPSKGHYSTLHMDHPLVKVFHSHEMKAYIWRANLYHHLSSKTPFPPTTDDCCNTTC